MKDVICSDFVKRQTRESEFSYFTGSWEELEDLTIANLSNVTEGYRDGVILVDISKDELHMFRSAVVHISQVEKFDSKVDSRRVGESNYLNTNGVGKKGEAKKVSIILYRKDVLEEDPLNTIKGSKWEIVSINASPIEKDLPMMPLAMARNELSNTKDGSGGTKGSYSPEQYAESIMFWSQHILVREE